MRKDGKRLKHADAMYSIANYVMAERSDALNYITIDLPMKPMQDYLNTWRKKGVQMSHMAIILAAFCRTVSQFPALNRFIVNRKAYSRNDLSAAMVVLKAGVDDGSETFSKMYFQPDYTIFEVNKEIVDYVERSRIPTEKNNFDRFIQKVVSFPGLLRFGIPFIKWMDKHGIMPKSVIELSPFHESLVITNMASLRTNHIYHHIYNFGTVSLFFAMGTPREVMMRRGKETYSETCMPIGVVMDERIASGAYMASSFKYFKKLVENPELLEEKPEKVIADPEL